MRAIGAALAFGLSACSHAPATVTPVASDFQEVPYPPPPAVVEETTESLSGRPDCQWIDGHYEWRRRRWQWIAGDWALPVPGCTYVPVTVAWGAPPNARLYYTPPRWYRADGKTLCQAPAPCRTPSPTP